MIIYKATNILNGKKYIGQTTKSLSDRIVYHMRAARCKSPYIFHKALRKYGIKNFEWEILCECDTQTELNEKEKLLIDENNSYYGKQQGYNMTFGGKGGVNGYIQTKECIEKRCGDNHWTHKKPFPEDAKRKIRESMLGSKNHFYGKSHDPETRKTQGLANIGNQYNVITIKGVTPEGNEILITNVSRFAKENKMRRGTIRKVLDGEKKLYRGWTFSRIGDNE